MSNYDTLLRHDLQLTAATFDVLDDMRGKEPLNPFFEDLLWSIPTFKERAQRLNIPRKPRRKPGRPKA